MGIRIVTAMFLVLGLAACGSPGATPTLEPTVMPPPAPTEAPTSPEEVQVALMAEWGPAYHRAAVITWTCRMAGKTIAAYNPMVIRLERALVEQDAERSFIDAAIRTTSSASTWSDAVSVYMNRLEDPTSVLINILESGRDGLASENLRGLLDTCDVLDEIWLDIARAAEAAGLSSESFDQLVTDLTAEYQQVMALEADRATAPPPVAIKATATVEIQVSDLPPQDEWRPAYVQGAVLFETCMMVFQTHTDYAQGTIGLERAEVELDVEAEFSEQVQRAVTSVSGHGATVIKHVARIDEQATKLLKLIKGDEAAIGSPDALSDIDALCGSLQSRMNAIVADANAAGLSSADMNALDAEASPLIEDLYRRTLYGR
jgi:hypothetical protein